MYKSSLTLDSGIGTIGGIHNALSVQLDRRSSLTRSLHAVHRRAAQGLSIERADCAARHHWAQTGISNFIRSHLTHIGCDPTRSTLPVSTNEWTQNAIEHGAKFCGEVRLDLVVGDDGIVAGITDPGTGFPIAKKLEQQERGESLLYDAQGYPMSRGFGLQGALHSRDVQIGFERLPAGFRVILLGGRKRLMEMFEPIRKSAPAERA